jgi:hypothetical protein
MFAAELSMIGGAGDVQFKIDKSTYKFPFDPGRDGGHEANYTLATEEYVDKKIINLHATDILTNQDAAAFVALTKDILDGKCNVFVKLNDAVGALVTEVYYSETECEWRVFGQAGKAFYTLTAVIDGENQSITLKEEPLASVFTQFMAEYLNSEAAIESKPTAADISEIFNEEEEA